MAWHINSHTQLGPGRFSKTNLMSVCFAATEPAPSLLPSSSAAAADDSSEQSGRVHMKEKNDIVMVETNSSGKWN